MINGIVRTAQINALLLFLTAIALTACGGGSASSPATAAATQPNTAPTISGTPPTTATVGTAYSFKPTASDASGSALTFSIANKPAWATFSAGSGQLSGTPSAADVGTASNITISVSDGQMSSSLASFAITVSAAASSGPPAATGSVTLDWTPPTNNVDGSGISNLAGYRIIYGNNPSSLTQTVDVPNAGSSSYVVQNLTPATWYFSVKAYNSAGEESAPSNPVSKLVQ